MQTNNMADLQSFSVVINFMATADDALELGESNLVQMYSIKTM
jgi:hypothetical protein